MAGEMAGEVLLAESRPYFKAGAPLMNALSRLEVSCRSLADHGFDAGCAGRCNQRLAG
jgi:hypothetical protein